MAVHGLSGGSAKTWTDNKSDPPFFWLRDGLGKDLEDCSILTYGYNAQMVQKERFPRPTMNDLTLELHSRLQKVSMVTCLSLDMAKGLLG